jgi:hypothetical protein
MLPNSAVMAQMMQTGQELAGVAVKTSETFEASVVVVGERVALTAARVPWSGDHAELNLMVSEKMSAFSEAGMALVREWHETGREAHSYWLDIGVAAFSGGFAVGRIMERTSRYGAEVASRAVGAAGLALAPIHLAVTDNAKRLSLTRREL